MTRRRRRQTSIDEHGITSVLAPADREADDIIEDLIRAAAVPKRLAVVSDDNRLRQAAGRRGATAMKWRGFPRLAPALTAFRHAES